jgi:hypothetical protein
MMKKESKYNSLMQDKAGQQNLLHPLEKELAQSCGETA